ncbi:hypothetical protein ACHAWX_002402 [Stephanocyclus meneghinianus]
MSGLIANPTSSTTSRCCHPVVNRIAGFSCRDRFFVLVLIFIMSLIPRNIKFETQVSSIKSAPLRDNHPPILYGHVHMAKTGGTSLNGILANKFENVCGHKGYTYDAYQENERAKNHSGIVKAPRGDNWSRSRVRPTEMTLIGYEDCDYISHETNWKFWKNTFGNGTFHGMRMELHVPCRNRIEHLMSQCNFHAPKKLELSCNATTDEELFKSVNKCLLQLDRYDHELLKHFEVKCFDFDKQFTGYVHYMSGILNRRRFESEPFIKRETNDARNKTEECIWNNPLVLEKVDRYLLNTIPYYQFCNNCTGSKNELVLSGID